MGIVKMGYRISTQTHANNGNNERHGASRVLYSLCKVVNLEAIACTNFGMLPEDTCDGAIFRVNSNCPNRGLLPCKNERWREAQDSSRSSNHTGSLSRGAPSSLPLAERGTGGMRQISKKLRVLRLLEQWQTLTPLQVAMIVASKDMSCQ
ncbi:hypothetical protein MRB53_039835 [Persea americana]|nr:hypothetical protein MRB53_039835 [Persea americana]